MVKDTKKFNNLAIKASAGTGKTYRLAMRYLSMLICDVEPERILAATFTNKAAGEILEKIVTESLKLAEYPDELENAIRKKDVPADTKQEDIIRVLRKLLACDKKLMISTIDSLFLNILRAFPLECGILGEITICDDNEIENMRTLALLRLIRDADAAQRSIIIDDLNQATFGSEEKSLVDAMKKAVLNYSDTYLNNPDPDRWGNLDNPYRHDALRVEELQRLNDEICALLIKEQITDKTFLRRVQSLINTTLTYARGTRIPSDDVRNLFNQFYEKVLAKTMKTSKFPDDNLDEIQIKDRPKLIIAGKLLKKIRTLFRCLLAMEVEFLNNRTKAVFALLKKFNDTYTKTARKAGLLHFSDIPYLITGNDQDHVCFIPENDQITSGGRLAVLEERLDTQTDHYMLDEFQDTSDSQWMLLKNLVDEVFQQQYERDRSFFYVGDIKQSIYQWREGNPRLFDRIRDQFQKRYGEDCIATEPLIKSFRSSKQVIECVNNVFLAPQLPEFDQTENYAILAKAMERLAYEKHISSEQAAKQKGCAILLELGVHNAKEDGAKHKNVMLKAEQIYDILRKIDPFNKGRKKPLTVGILLRKNDSCTDYMDAFREINNRIENRNNTIPALVDGDMNPADSMAVTALIQMLRFAYHPADKFAEEYLNMMRFPAMTLNGVDSINRIFYPEKCNSFSLPENIRSEISTESLYAFTCHFRKIFCKLSEFDTVRLEIVTAAAMDFKNGDIDFFVEQIRNGKYKSASGKDSNAVQIMTIHKSKGLDFDIVFLPENKSRSGITTKNLSQKLVVNKDEQDVTQNIAFLTTKDLLHAFADQETIKNKADDDACYEALCGLYVAMTRARYALYMFVTREKDGTENNTAKKKKEVKDPVNWDSISYESILRYALDKPAESDPDDGIYGNILYLNGEKDWYTRLQKEETEEAQPVKTPVCRVRTHRRKEQIAPSTSHESADSWKYRFAQLKSADLGTRVHELFSKIADIRDFVPEDHMAPEELNGKVGEIVNRAVTSEDIRNKLSETGSRLWREKRFLITNKNGAVISGTFDRVVIHDDESGNPVSAEIIDFKTDNKENNKVDDAYYVRSYEKQLILYRETLSRMLDLPEAKITCTILALCHGKVITI